MKREDRIKEVIQELGKMYPQAECSLRYDGIPERLVIATILSAQTTDDAVNRATPGLWERYPDMGSLASAALEDVQLLLKTIGLFRNKSVSIVKAAGFISANGLPDTIEGLVQIPGVGRKTANVILGEIFGKPSITVDTHVKRLSARLDLSDSNDPDKIEADLKKLVPEGIQTVFSHRLIAHGRKVCRARRPECPVCHLIHLCPFNKKGGPKGTP